jgi:GH25 family lysozyme M1 (1,4-beta-N-acetylmuramidase)
MKLPVPPAGYVNMIDVSKWQGDVDWSKAMADPNAPVVVACRATLGHTYQDSKYQDYMRALVPFDVLQGAYHVSTPNVSPSAHLRNMEDAMNKAPDPDFVILDVEIDNGMGPQAIASHAYECLVGLEALGFKDKVMIYTADWFWSNKVGGIPLSSNAYKPMPSDWALWVAHYKPLGAGGPKLPIGWAKYYAWQHSDRGEIDGMPSSVDLNIMKESYHSFLGGSAPPPVPVPVPIPPPGEFKNLQVKGEVRLV